MSQFSFCAGFSTMVVQRRW